MPHPNLGYQFFNEHCTDVNGIVAFIDDDTFVRFDQINQLYDDETGNSDEMFCLRGNRIQLEHAPYYGKYYIWQDQSEFKMIRIRYQHFFENRKLKKTFKLKAKHQIRLKFENLV